MILLTIFNSLVILYLLLKANNRLYVTFKKEQTTWDKVLYGYSITLWKKRSYGSSGIYTIYIPIRNRAKLELMEEVNRLISSESTHNKIYTLTAKFSWLKTVDEVKQFEKDYMVVDEKTVQGLVANFVPK